MSTERLHHELERAGLLENTGGKGVHARKRWRLTPLGNEVARTLSLASHGEPILCDDGNTSRRRRRGQGRRRREATIRSSSSDRSFPGA